MDARIKGLAAAGIIAGLLYAMKTEPGPDSSSGGGSKFNPFATVSGGMAGGGGGAPDVTYTTYNIPAPVFPAITAPSFSSSSTQTKKEINSGQSTTLHRPQADISAIMGRDKYGLKKTDEYGIPLLPHGLAQYVKQPKQEKISPLANATKKEQKQTQMPDALKLPAGMRDYVK